jgi:hypothetical protein
VMWWLQAARFNGITAAQMARRSYIAIPDIPDRGMGSG